MNGRSDQGGWRSTQRASGPVSFPKSPSSARKTAPAPASISSVSVARSGHTTALTFVRRNSSAAASASRPMGAKTRTLSSRSALPIFVVRNVGNLTARVLRVAGKNPAESGERRPKADARAAEAEFADGVLMVAAALFHDRKGAAYSSGHLEIAQHENGVAQIADVERRIHRADQPVLGEHKHRQDSLLSQVAQQFMHLQNEEALIRHGVHIAIEAVDNDDPCAVGLDAVPYICRELSGREFGGIDLLETDQTRGDVLLQGQSERTGASFHGAAALVEGEEHRMFATFGGCDDVGQRE